MTIDCERLAALWTSDEAVVDDPGVSSTLTLSSFSAKGVVGIDVLNGFEQELIFENTDGDACSSLRSR